MKTCDNGKPNQKSFVTYEHHGCTVFVQEHLKGSHREHCLCYSCAWFKPEGDRKNQCPIADAVYKNCVEHNIVTPVWECPKFTEASKEEEE
jgi:hypothetical protein